MQNTNIDIGFMPAKLKDSEGPFFREPWEAHAFAIAVKLSEQGHFTWIEWADYFAEEIRLAGPEAAHDARDYYVLWLRALERLVAEKKLLASTDLSSRKQYLHDNPVPHSHIAMREPICIA